MAPDARMIDRIPAIEARIANLDAGMTRIENLLKNEIADLKQEQIADLRRDLRGAQDEIIVMRNAISKIYETIASFKGGLSALNWAFISIGGLIGAGVAFAAKLIFKI